MRGEREGVSNRKPPKLVWHSSAWVSRKERVRECTRFGEDLVKIEMNLVLV